jgi:malonyl-CoA/methylmalonyl-CoA synthetase
MAKPARSTSKAPTSSPAIGGARSYARRVRRWLVPHRRPGRRAPPDGYYTLCSTQGDLIISGGFNIYPREIEEFLQEQEEVAEAAVAGHRTKSAAKCPSPTWCCSAIEPAELERRCRAKLASFKVPRAFIPVDHLPRNAMGKIQKHLLPKN